MSLFLVVFVLVGSHLLFSIDKMTKLQNNREEIVLQINYWQKVVVKYKDYRDGYFQLAILEYQLKDIGKAKMYLDEVFKLDPNFEKGRELERILNSK